VGLDLNEIWLLLDHRDGREGELPSGSEIPPSTP
jgi:hypothetical protein